ncbi:MAG TPA: hypothetical protein VK166_11015 [Chitinophagaceae bacterium]|nr:hypothetical protein [Chitinophagaceae bacterium]
MKKILMLSLILCIFSVSNRIQAQEYKMALGARFTAAQATVNNAISFRYFLNENNALEGLLSFDPVTIGGLYEVYRPLGAPGFQWFFGGGAYVSFNDNDVVGAMGVVGLDYKFQKVPINISIDWKPELSLVKEVGFEAATVGLGIRFAFK